MTATDSGKALIALVNSGMAKWDPSAGDSMNVPMPFQSRICLIEDTHVAGTTHVKGIDDLLDKIEVGQELRLERDPKNMRDRWAIRVYAGNERIGYVSCDKNEILARLMDGGKRIGARVTELERIGGWNKIHMEVYLED